VAVLGPNGAGKTTGIGVMLGLRRPDSGTARLFGMDPQDRRAHSRCGVMLQESGVNGNLKVRELVRIFGALYPHPLPVATAIKMAGLDEKANALASKLSGGDKQRLYYALAVCGDPDVLFLDEPTVGLDVEARHHFIDSIRDFAAAGRTLVLTTHILEEADELAARIVVIDRGVVIADGTPTEIKSKVGGKRVSFVAARPLTEADLAGLSVTGLEISGNRVRLFSNDADVVVTKLIRGGLDLHDLEVVGAGLEDAFLSLTSTAESRAAG
jgi:ABC-2 type transport system ATP-binding protein